MPKQTQLVPKRLVYFIYEGILNTRGDHAFFMGAENAKTKSAEKSAETGGHQKLETKLTYAASDSSTLLPYGLQKQQKLHTGK